MPDIEQIPSLIGDIYDAALDPSRWTSVLQKTRDVVGGSAAAVFSKDARSNSLNVHYHCGGIDARYQQLHIEKYEKLDPSTTAHGFGGHGFCGPWLGGGVLLADEEDTW